jgi:hypothetical protein
VTQDYHFNWFQVLGCVLVGGLVLAIIVILILPWGYINHNVGSNEIGIVFNKNKVTGVVGPGVYTNLALWHDIKNVKVEGVAFCAEDPEVLTQDQQRIGLKVCATVFRPSFEDQATYVAKWDEYSTIYLSDDPLITPVMKGDTVIRDALMQSLSQQAMKVCVGNKDFAQAAVGTARDELRECIDTEISKLAQPYGLSVDNVVVPNIAINPSVQELLDQITQEKFQTDLERQQALRAAAEADRKLAEEQGNIRVEEGKKQEEQRQKAITAGLEKDALEAQLDVIVAQKANDLKDAQLSLEISQAQLEVAQTNAKAELADVFALAGLYADNPAYLTLLINEKWAEAWNGVDKIIVPAGSSPQTILNPDGVDVVIPVQPTTNTAPGE